MWATSEFQLGEGGLEVFDNRAAGKRARWTIARKSEAVVQLNQWSS